MQKTTWRGSKVNTLEVMWKEQSGKIWKCDNNPLRAVENDVRKLLRDTYIHVIKARRPDIIRRKERCLTVDMACQDVRVREKEQVLDT